MNKVVNLEEILKKYTNVSSIDYEDCLVAMKEMFRMEMMSVIQFNKKIK